MVKDTCGMIWKPNPAPTQYCCIPTSSPSSPLAFNVRQWAEYCGLWHPSHPWLSLLMGARIGSTWPVDGSQNWQYLACYVVHNDTIEAYPVEKEHYRTCHNPLQSVKKSHQSWTNLHYRSMYESRNLNFFRHLSWQGIC
jgi:hypothetical protein